MSKKKDNSNNNDNSNKTESESEKGNMKKTNYKKNEKERACDKTSEEDQSFKLNAVQQDSMETKNLTQSSDKVTARSWAAVVAGLSSSSSPRPSQSQTLEEQKQSPRSRRLEKKREHSKLEYKKNPEKEKERKKTKYGAVREKQLSQQHESYQNNPEMREKRQEWNKGNQEKITEYMAKHYREKKVKEREKELVQKGQKNPLHGFETNLELARELLADISGHDYWNASGSVEDLSNQIKDRTVQNTEKNNCYASYMTDMHQDVPVIDCACCGEKDILSLLEKRSKFSIDLKTEKGKSIAGILRLDEQRFESKPPKRRAQQATNYRLKVQHFLKIRNNKIDVATSMEGNEVLEKAKKYNGLFTYYEDIESDNNDAHVLYSIHPDLVKDRKFEVCRRCYCSLKKKRIPIYSIRSGYDYGSIERLQLPMLSSIEKAVLGQCSAFGGSIIKLTQNKVGKITEENEMSAISGHLIVFSSTVIENPKIAEESASLDVSTFINRTVESIGVSFVGTLPNWSFIKSSIRKFRILSQVFSLDIKNLLPWVEFLTFRERFLNNVPGMEGSIVGTTSYLANLLELHRKTNIFGSQKYMDEISNRILDKCQVCSNLEANVVEAQAASDIAKSTLETVQLPEELGEDDNTMEEIVDKVVDEKMKEEQEQEQEEKDDEKKLLEQSGSQLMKRDPSEVFQVQSENMDIVDVVDSGKMVISPSVDLSPTESKMHEMTKEAIEADSGKMLISPMHEPVIMSLPPPAAVNVQNEYVPPSLETGVSIKTSQMGNAGKYITDMNKMSAGVLIDNLCSTAGKTGPLRQMIAAANKTLSKTTAPSLVFKRQNDPYNEFQNNQQLILSLFFYLFVAGIGVYESGSMPDSFVRHLLMQYDGRFGQDQTFIFLAFNQYMRHSYIRGVSARIDSDLAAEQRFANWLQDETFQQQLRTAINDPESKVAVDLLKEIVPIMKVTIGVVPRCGPDHQRSIITNLINYVRFFGYPTMFITISPHDLESVFGLKFSIGAAKAVSRNCGKVPFSDAQSFVLDEENEENIALNLLDNDFRSQIIQNNPHFHAIAFEHMVHAFCKHLLKLDLDTNIKKSTSTFEKDLGIAGKISAFYGVVETQARGTLHLHLLIFGGSLNRHVLDRAAIENKLRPVMERLINSIITAHVSKEAACNDLVRRLEMKSAERPVLRKLYEGKNILSYLEAEHDNKPHNFMSDLNLMLQQSICATNYHSHAATCHKGKSGKIACRFGYPQNLVEETRPVCLISRYQEVMEQPTPEEVEKYRTKITPESRNELKQMKRIAVAAKDQNNKNGLRLPKSVKDDAIYWELVRPLISISEGIPEELQYALLQYTGVEHGQEKINTTIEKFQTYNTNIVEYNDCIAASLFCNQSVQMIGSTKQALAATFYCTEYMAKKETEIVKTLSVLWQAIQDVKSYPSTAEDKDTETRKAKHLSERTVNKWTGKDEISFQMASWIAIGNSLSIGSHRGRFIDIWSPLKLIKENPERNQPEMEIEELGRVGTGSRTHTFVPVTPLVDVDEMESDEEAGMESARYMKAEEELNESIAGLSLSDKAIQEEKIKYLSDLTNYNGEESIESRHLLPVIENPHYTEEELEKNENINEGPDLMEDVEIGLEDEPEGNFDVKRFKSYKSKCYEKDDGSKLWMSDWEHYYYRGEELLELSYFEYTSLIAVEKQKQKSKKGKVQQTEEQEEEEEEEDEEEQEEEEENDNDENDDNDGPEDEYDEEGQKRNRRGKEKGANEIVTKVKAKAKIETGSGRKANKRFQFSPLHPLQSTLIQRLRSKLEIPFLAGQKPPRLDNIILEKIQMWESLYQEDFNNVQFLQIKNCAEYYLTLMVPWRAPKQRGDPVYGPDCPLTVCSLRNWLRKGIHEQLSRIQNFLRNYVIQTITLFKANPAQVYLYGNYRRRGAKVWARTYDPTNVGTQDKKDELKSKIASAVSAMHELQQTAKATGDKSIQKQLEEEQYFQFLRETMPKRKTGGSNQVRSEWTGIMKHYMVSHTDYQLNKPPPKLEKIEQPPSEKVNSRAERPIYMPLPMTEEEFIKYMNKKLKKPDRRYGPGQSRVLHQIAEAVRCHVVGQRQAQKLMLMHGGPGTGKTTVIQSLSEYFMAEYESEFPRIAPTGIAASLIAGKTFHKYFGISGKGTKIKSADEISPQTLNEIRLSLRNLNLLIIDEISMLSLKFFVLLEETLRKALGSKKPFGGVNIVLVGDFFQLTPVQSTSIAKNLVDREVEKLEIKATNPNIGEQQKSEKENTKQNAGKKKKMKKMKEGVITSMTEDVVESAATKERGAALLKMFEKVELVVQQRMVEDQESGDRNAQVEMVSAFRDLNKLGQPFLTEDVFKKIEIIDLDKELESGNLEWLLAPVVVTTNREKSIINAERVKEYARFLKVPVIRYRLPIKPNHNYSLNTEAQEEIYNGYAEPYMYFVPHAPCTLLHNFDVENGYANGTTVYLHSLVYSKSMSEAQIKKFENECARAENVGKFVDLPEPPASILVYKGNDENHLICGSQPKLPPPTAELFSIQIGEPMSCGKREEFKGILPSSNTTFKATYRNYGIQLKFSLTFHKIQGITASKLILQLSYCPAAAANMLNFHALYVALSRTRSFKSMRKMIMRVENYSHLTSVTCPVWLAIFMKMFQEESGKWIEDPVILKGYTKQYNYGLDAAKANEKKKETDSNNVSQAPMVASTVSNKTTKVPTHQETSASKRKEEKQNVEGKSEHVLLYTDPNKASIEILRKGFIWGDNSCSFDTLVTCLLHLFIQLEKYSQKELCRNDDSQTFADFKILFMRNLSYNEALKTFKSYIEKQIPGYGTYRTLEDMYSQLFKERKNKVFHEKELLEAQYINGGYSMDFAIREQVQCENCKQYRDLFRSYLHTRMINTFKNASLRVFIDKTFKSDGKIKQDYDENLCCNSCNQPFPEVIPVRTMPCRYPPILYFETCSPLNYEFILEETISMPCEYQWDEPYRLGAIIYFSEEKSHFISAVWSFGQWCVYDGLKNSGKFRILNESERFQFSKHRSIKIRNIMENIPQVFEHNYRPCVVLYFKCAEIHKQKLQLLGQQKEVNLSEIISRNENVGEERTCSLGMLQIINLSAEASQPRRNKQKPTKMKLEVVDLTHEDEQANVPKRKLEKVKRKLEIIEIEQRDLENNAAVLQRMNRLRFLLQQISEDELNIPAFHTIVDGCGNNDATFLAIPGRQRERLFELFNMPDIPKFILLRIPKEQQDQMEAQNQPVCNADEIYFQDWKKLGPRIWLHGDILMIASFLIRKELLPFALQDRRVLVLDTSFLPTFLSEEEESKILRKIRNMMRKYGEVYRFFRYQRVIVMVHINNSHFITIRFDPAIMTITVYDSLHREAPPEKHTTCMKQVIVLWENEYRKAQFQRENPGRDLPEEHYIKMQQIKVKICLSPRQPNGYDCGLYTLCNTLRMAVEPERTLPARYENEMINNVRYLLALILIKNFLIMSAIDEIIAELSM